MSHDWPEWEKLSQEIISALDRRGIVFAFVGAVAKRGLPFVSERSEFLTVSHPSPRGNINSSNPFSKSRFFSTINDLLGNSPIDWRLDPPEMAT